MRSTYYQVIARFRLDHGKPQLLYLSFHSVHFYLPYLFNPGGSLSVSRIYETEFEAHDYIHYLLKKYLRCAVPYPVLEDLQLSLF
jgi:hypothetical protein